MRSSLVKFKYRVYTKNNMFKDTENKLNRLDKMSPRNSKLSTVKSSELSSSLNK